MEVMKKNDDPIVNRVAKSKIITIDLEDFINSNEIVSMDLKDYLFREMILREKDFREHMASFNWQSLQNKVLWIYCSVDAVIPLWAYMLISSNATDYAKIIFQGDEMALNTHIILYEIDQLNTEEYMDKPIIIKGCGSKPIHPQVYVAITNRIQKKAKTIMFGEPCSTVPIYKKGKTNK